MKKEVEFINDVLEEAKSGLKKYIAKNLEIDFVESFDAWNKSMKTTNAILRFYFDENKNHKLYNYNDFCKDFLHNVNIILEKETDYSKIYSLNDTPTQKDINYLDESNDQEEFDRKINELILLKIEDNVEKYITKDLNKRVLFKMLKNNLGENYKDFLNRHSPENKNTKITKNGKNSINKKPIQSRKSS